MPRSLGWFGLLALVGVAGAGGGVWELELSTTGGDSQTGTRLVAGDVVQQGGLGGSIQDVSFQFVQNTELVPDSGIGLLARRFVGPRFAIAGELSALSYDLATTGTTFVQLIDTASREVLFESLGTRQPDSEGVDAYLAAIRGEIHFAPERRVDPYVGLSVGAVEYDKIASGFDRLGIEGGATFGAVAGLGVPLGARGVYLALTARWDSLTLESRMRNLSELDFAPYSLEGTYAGGDSANKVRFSLSIGARFGEHR